MTEVNWTIQSIEFSRPEYWKGCSKGQVQTVAFQEREEKQRPRRNSQETIVQPWDRILVPSQGKHTHNNIIDHFCRIKTPSECMMLTTCGSFLQSREQVTV